ncbi:MAG: DNA methyltransferase [Pirellulales bacterium]
MPISWNEIRSRAVAFSKEWAAEHREDAEAKTFWDDFFKVFGLTRRHLASFEEPVKHLGGHYKFIDLFWKGVLLAEHKSRGSDLGKAHSQAMAYVQDLINDGRTDDVPRYVIVSDFARIALYDLEADSQGEQSFVLELPDLHRHVNRFGFIPGYKQHKLEPEDPINIKAVQIMGDLHDALEAGGYSGHDLERLLVRILFCLFADDTGIFERDTFKLFLENRTREDGSDLGPQLARLFAVLNRPPENRQKNLLDELASLPYVNGDLYAEPLSFAEFNRDMRNRLLACTKFDWSRISPAVFGALFQAVMEPQERRQIGAHYTSERDILKVIGTLFLDELRAELASAGNDNRKLKALHERLAQMRLLDPACGCGNFLVISYRELRLMELEIVRRLHKREQTQRRLDVNTLLKIDVDQMYGIEIEEWPVRIAEVAMWLMDHQMNQRVSEEFGEYFVRLPLRKSPHIHHGNALRTDWNEVLPASQCTNVLGNPPFVGKQFRNDAQVEDMRVVWGPDNGGQVVDYVGCWYLKAIDYMVGTNIRAAFVSTNSISQGEQCGVLWAEMNRRAQAVITFAHRTFRWESEARGRAHVHVVIIGFSLVNINNKRIFEYENGASEPTVVKASNINAYLVDGPNVFIESRTIPISPVPPIVFGSMPNDGGHLLLSAEERRALLAQCPDAKRLMKRFVGAVEFINGIDRWCLWLVDASPDELRRMKPVMQRIQGVKSHRESSRRATTRELAAAPTLFGEIRQPSTRYLLVPSVSSENRKFIPIGFNPPSVIASNLTLVVPLATHFHFGVLSSSMHMAWVRHVAGRLKSDFRYSAKLVYNNYPWPPDVSLEKQAAVEEAAKGVLDAREAHPDATLADLYDPLSTPADLTKAHARLDRAVDRCYRSQPFANERNRVEYLFNLYQRLTAPLLPAPSSRRRKPAS